VSDSILGRIAAGDPAAVDECLEKYGGLVWSLVRRFSVNHADAEDVVQEIFIDVWRHAGRYDDQIAAESTFISTIARRRLIDRRRKLGRRPEVVSLPEESAVAVTHQHQQLETIEEAERARKLMQQLRPDERQVLELAIDDGMSQSQIAEATSLPLGTVKTHTRRGLIRLRKLLNAAETSADV
jgi:RNA polymerase sigma-70 factor (ECF subfamily)